MSGFVSTIETVFAALVVLGVIGGLVAGLLEDWAGQCQADDVAEAHLDGLRAAARLSRAAFAMEQEIYAEAARHRNEGDERSTPRASYLDQFDPER